MKSIRSFLLARLLGGAALILALFTAAVGLVVSRSLEAQFDESLTGRIQALYSLLFQVKDEVQFEFSDQLMPEYEREERPAYFEVRYEDGRLLEGSASLHGKELAAPAELGGSLVHWKALLPDGRTGRYAARVLEVHHVYPEEGPDRPVAARVRVVVAEGLEDLAAAERSLLGYCLAGGLALLGLLALLAWIAVDRGLAPARRLASTLDAIEVEGLPESLEPGALGVEALPSELRPIGRTIDALLHRIDTALRRERRTTADIAHELRTPISELVTVSEIALRDGRDPASSRKALGAVRDIAWGMGRSVSTLLKLARFEMGAEAPDLRPVDLGRMLEEVLRSFSGLARERGGIRIDNRIEPGVSVVADGDVLRIVLQNLLSNALYYVPRGGRVACSLERAGGRWTFLVENDAPGLDPEDLRFLAEPFWRKDRARNDRNRSGLGLALACALAGRTAMEIEFTLEEGTFRAGLSGADDRGTGPPAASGIPAERQAE